MTRPCHISNLSPRPLIAVSLPELRLRSGTAIRASRKADTFAPFSDMIAYFQKQAVASRYTRSMQCQSATNTATTKGRETNKPKSANSGNGQALKPARVR